MNLSKHTMDELRYRLDCVQPDQIGDQDWNDPEQDWPELQKELEAVVQAGTIQSLKENPAAANELENILGHDICTGDNGRGLTAIGKAIFSDMARAGYQEKFDESAVRSSRPRTLAVDGVRYVCG